MLLEFDILSLLYKKLSFLLKVMLLILLEILSKTEFNEDDLSLEFNTYSCSYRLYYDIILL